MPGDEITYPSPPQLGKLASQVKNNVCLMLKPYLPHRATVGLHKKTKAFGFLLRIAR